MSAQGLAAFGVDVDSDRGYLVDTERGFIVAEGTLPAVRAKVQEWTSLFPVPYRAMSYDEVDLGMLQEWGRFRAREGAHWVIADES